VAQAKTQSHCPESGVRDLDVSERQRLDHDDYEVKKSYHVIVSFVPEKKDVCKCWKRAMFSQISTHHAHCRYYDAYLL